VVWADVLDTSMTISTPSCSTGQQPARRDGVVGPPPRPPGSDRGPRADTKRWFFGGYYRPLVLTSSAEQRDVVDSYDLGVNSYITKPVDYAQFMTAIRSIGRYWLRLNHPPVLPAS
jgi:hypothetical protein